MNKRTYRIVIGDLPEAADRRELLELVLAAASLDLHVQVRLLGRARELLDDGIDSAWRQLEDQALAEILTGQTEDVVATGPAGRPQPSASDGPIVVIRT